MAKGFEEDLAFQVDEEVLKGAKEKLKKLTGAWNSGVCYGDCIDLNGASIPNIYVHTGCHAWVTTAFRQRAGKNFLTLTCHAKKRSTCSEAAKNAIILWMARESKFSKYVLNRDDDESLTNYGAILLCGKDGLTEGEAMWVCKVLRYSTEGSKSLDTWLALKEGGVNPMLALRICTDICNVQGATFGAGTVTSHLAVFNNDWDAKKEPDLKALAICDTNKKATSTGDLFVTKDSPNKHEYSAAIKNFCKAVKMSDGWGGEVRAAYVSKDQLVTQALAWQKTVLGEPVERAAAPPKKKLPTRETVFLEADM